MIRIDTLLGGVLTHVVGRAGNADGGEPPSHTTPAAQQAVGVRAFPAQRMWDVVREVRQPRLMAVAGWLWRQGVHDADELEAMIRECARLRPRSPYAYFAKTGAARGAIAAVTQGDKRVAEHNAERAADDAWLASVAAIREGKP